MALDTATERGPLMLRPSPRLMPGWDMVDSMATDLALVMEVMAMVDSDTDMARGPLMLRLSPMPMPGWDMVDSNTDMARGPLMLRLSHGWDTVDSTATVVLALAMAVMAMVDSDTDMARGPLMLKLSPRPMPGTDMVAFMAMESQLMAATAMDLDSMARSKQNQIPRLTISYNTP